MNTVFSNFVIYYFIIILNIDFVCQLVSTKMHRLLMKINLSLYSSNKTEMQSYVAICNGFKVNYNPT